jgi:ribosomal protein S18 acetylase RimI-like enzyme
MSHRSYFLELTSAEDFRPKSFPGPGVSISRAGASDARLCAHLWREAGRGFWTERVNWLSEQWHVHLRQPSVSFWIARAADGELGFFELATNGAEAKLEGLGLLPQARNRGLGGGLVSAATQRAFDLGASRIWLHTASDDHPHALPNYQKRGYRIYHEEELKHPVSENAPGPLPADTISLQP